MRPSLAISGPSLAISGVGALSAVTLLVPSSAWASEGLNLFPDPRWLGLHFVLLLLLIYPVRRMLLDPLMRVLLEREERITGAKARAESLDGESESLSDQVEQRLRQARAAATEARATVLAEAEAEERHVLDLARAEASKTVAAVRDSVHGELDAARRALEGQSAGLAREAAARILGRAL